MPRMAPAASIQKVHPWPWVASRAMPTARGGEDGGYLVDAISDPSGRGRPLAAGVVGDDDGIVGVGEGHKEAYGDGHGESRPEHPKGTEAPGSFGFDDFLGLSPVSRIQV